MSRYESKVCNLEDYVCPICGKRFIPGALHAYRNKKTHKKYCSWTCYRKAQKESPGDFMNKKSKVIY